jgi:acetolactate synthase small subunit
MSCVAGTTVYRVSGMHDPGFLSRIVELFAQRGVAPSRLSMRGDGHSAKLQLSVEGLDEHAATVIAAKIGSMVMVEQVDLRMQVPVGCGRADEPLMAAPAP